MACRPHSQGRREANGTAVRISLLNEGTALGSTISFLKNRGCSNDGLLAFEKAVNYYNFLPLELDRSKFPRPENGFYTFQSVTQLLAALPHKLCETKHPFQLNCYDTVIFLADGQLTSGIGPGDVFGCSVAPQTATNWEVMLSPVATAEDAYDWSWPQSYQQLIESFIPAGSLKSRINLLAALYSFQPLPIRRTPQDSQAQTVLETLRFNWNRQSIRFPRKCVVVLCHDVMADKSNPDKFNIFTVHAGLLFNRSDGFTYIEKNGGFGPFVRLDFGSKSDLLRWLSGNQYHGDPPENGKHFRTFVTFNQNEIEEPPAENQTANEKMTTVEPNKVKP